MRSARRTAIGVGGAVVLLAALDAYVITTILITVVGDLGIPVNHLERATPIITGFLLGYVAAMPLLGQLSDRFGRKPLLHACLAVFAAGSVITALADHIPLLVTGRAVQGIAGGALLPITMALAGDLWAERERPVVLGAVGAAQELGSVLGPLYGAGIAATALGWRGIFWINVPLVVAAMIAVQFSVPKETSAHTGARVDVTGGILLAAGLSLLVIGLYNPDAEKSALSSWGLPLLVAGAAVLVVFGFWERRAPVKLLDLTGVRKTPLFATLGVSLLAGAALMVTLWAVQLVVQTLQEKSAVHGAVALTWFLVTLVVAAVLGGLLARRIGERWTVVGGMAIAAAGYLLISEWPVHADTASYGGIPRMDVDLVVAGFGLGLVIAPVSAAVLRSVPAAQHGVASAAVVVARMMGMLLGVAGLSAWGFYRFQSLAGDLKMPLPFGVKQDEFNRQAAAYKKALQHALHTEYSEIFLITAVLCALGAVVGLLLRDASPPVTDRRSMAESGHVVRPEMR
jgi:MFS family permease